MGLCFGVFGGRYCGIRASILSGAASGHGRNHGFSPWLNCEALGFEPGGGGHQVGVGAGIVAFFAEMKDCQRAI